MANLEKYMDLQADFYHYMVEFGGWESEEDSYGISAHWSIGWEFPA